jgi:hypothetical protein
MKFYSNGVGVETLKLLGTQTRRLSYFPENLFGYCTATVRSRPLQNQEGAREETSRLSTHGRHVATNFCTLRCVAV